MLITSTVEICIQHLGRVEEMVFAARRSYASAVLGVVILSVCPSVRLSVCHTRAFWLIQRTYRRYFYSTWTGNPSSQMWFFVQLCSSWQDFNWLKGSRGLSAAAELLVRITISIPWRLNGKIPWRMSVKIRKYGCNENHSFLAKKKQIPRKTANPIPR